MNDATFVGIVVQSLNGVEQKVLIDKNSTRVVNRMRRNSIIELIKLVLLFEGKVGIPSGIF